MGDTTLATIMTEVHDHGGRKSTERPMIKSTGLHSRSDEDSHIETGFGSSPERQVALAAASHVRGGVPQAYGEAYSTMNGRRWSGFSGSCEHTERQPEFISSFGRLPEVSLEVADPVFARVCPS